MNIFTILMNGIVNYFFGTPIYRKDTDLQIGYDTPLLYLIPALILVFLVGYLLGSINFATFISKKKYNDDIREHGSGNAGMTNMMRTYGSKAAALTLVGDFLKTVISVMFGYLLCGITGAYVAGVAAVIGHTWPLYYKFKGGKGVVTAITMILFTDFFTGLLLLVIFVAIVAASRYISLGSVMGALIYPIILSNLNPGIGFVEVICSFIIVFLLVFNHRTNIMRLYRGEENKFSFKKSK